MIKIDYNSYRSVKGFNRRVRFLIMHYTALNFNGSVNALTGASVSAHYLVPDFTDKTYIDAGFTDERIFNLVDEHERAWHAGVSTWAGRTNINDSSIGIEIVNEAKSSSEGFIFPPYPDSQVEAIISLAYNILQRYPDITPTQVVGHSDIALGRKSDPGASFPWQRLYEAGVGAWYDESTKQMYMERFAAGLPDKNEIISKFKTYGYNTQEAASAHGYRVLVRAFQLHFRQQDYAGVMDAETAAILYALVDKYFAG